MKIELKTGDICLLISLCESAGQILSDKDKFKLIATEMRRQIGIE